MIAGTLALLEEPVDEPLDTWFRDRDLPAIHVERTQTSFDDRPVQQGTAATRVETTRRDAAVAVNAEGEAIALDVTDEPAMQDVSSEWVADITGSGLVAAESLTGTDEYAFPFDIIAARTERSLQRVYINVAKLHSAWSEEDALGDVWMTGTDDEDSASIQYHDAADVETKPTIGLGFVRPWNGTVERGVVYESGYVAIYSSNTASSFVRFVEEELLPYRYEQEDDAEQTTLTDDGDETPTCDECGRESNSVGEILPGLCIVCGDKKAEEIKEGSDVED